MKYVETSSSIRDGVRWGGEGWSGVLRLMSTYIDTSSYARVRDGVKCVRVHVNAHRDIKKC